MQVNSPKLPVILPSYTSVTHARTSPQQHRPSTEGATSQKVGMQGNQAAPRAATSLLPTSRELNGLGVGSHFDTNQNQWQTLDGSLRAPPLLPEPSHASQSNQGPTLPIIRPDENSSAAQRANATNVAWSTSSKLPQSEYSNVTVPHNMTGGGAQQDEGLLPEPALNLRPPQYDSGQSALRPPQFSNAQVPQNITGGGAQQHSSYLTPEPAPHGLPPNEFEPASAFDGKWGAKTDTEYDTYASLPKDRAGHYSRNENNKFVAVTLDTNDGKYKFADGKVAWAMNVVHITGGIQEWGSPNAVYQPGDQVSRAGVVSTAIRNPDGRIGWMYEGNFGVPDPRFVPTPESPRG